MRSNHERMHVLLNAYMHVKECVVYMHVKECVVYMHVKECVTPNLPFGSYIANQLKQIYSWLFKQQIVIYNIVLQ